MIAITVDDENWTLNMLSTAVKSSADISEVYSFSSCTDTLNWAKENSFDIAFLDINMRGIGGIRLATELRKINPECYIIFCTGFEEYAVEAFRIHADGYLLKPIDKDAVQEELNHILKKSKNALLTIKCFGGFEVYDTNGKLVPFRRSKTKELFALLVDKKGMGTSSREICTILWADDFENDKKHMRYLWNLFSDLSRTLKQVNASKVLVKVNTSYLIDTSIIKCDFYDYIKKKDTKINLNTYMPQYSWAESTVALFSHKN